MSEKTADVLADWLQHPGTQLFFQHVNTEWGPGGQRFEATINRIADSREDDAINLRQMQQIAVCRREILKLQQWAGEEIARLRQLELPKDNHPRRAPEPELYAMTRRGGL